MDFVTDYSVNKSPLSGATPLYTLCSIAYYIRHGKNMGLYTGGGGLHQGGYTGDYSNKFLSVIPSEPA